jgi:cellulose synthase/poly-beta-1,6-N-acetylglucosamine synthase-like glycosyltransferase
VCACVIAAALAAAGCSMLGAMLLPLALLLITTLNLATSSMEAQWRAYAWRSPEAAAQLAWPSPIAVGDERMRFSLIVCALNEAEVIGDTLRSLIRQTHRERQIIVSLRAFDLATIEAVRAFERRHPGAIEVVIGDYTEHGKAAQLNGALPYCTGDAVSPIDAEGDVAPELLMHVEALFRQTGADVVQGAVQLMNLGSRLGQWFQAHSVLEYQAWYSSRMLFQVQAGFVPLGGNTVFIRTELVRRAGGWPCTPTEDCAIGVLLCSQYGAKVVAAYGPDLATREEVPATVFNKDKGSIFWQRVRWLDGIFQELVRGTWLRMPTLRRKILAGYILAAPILQSLSCALLPVALITAVTLKVPESVALYTFVPVIPIAFTMMAMVAGLRQFGRDFGQQIRARHYASIVFLTPLYQALLAAAAAVAIYKYLSGDKSWYRTGRSMEHRGLAPVGPHAEELVA